MSNSGTTVRVGSFADKVNEKGQHIVPQSLVGNKVWYSSKYGYFRITDENNETVGQFDLKQFEKYYKAQVITYASSGVKAHMEHLLQQQNELKDLFSPIDSFEDEEPKETSDFVEEEQSLFELSEEQQTENELKAIKDPTIHCAAFFITTIIISIVAFIVIRFGRQIIEAVSGLL